MTDNEKIARVSDALQLTILQERIQELEQQLEQAQKMILEDMQLAQQEHLRIIQMGEQNAKLVEALQEASSQVKELCTLFKVPIPEDSFEKYDAALKEMGVGG